MTVSAAQDAALQQLRKNFEGREAIYIEKGALHVRVSNIRWDTALRAVFADIEEIPTPGFNATTFHMGHKNDSTPCRWDISTASLTSFSDTEWSMGYGGWSIYFAPRVVKGVVELALRWPKELDEHARYRQVLDFIYGHHA